MSRELGSQREGGSRSLEFYERAYYASDGRAYIPLTWNNPRNAAKLTKTLLTRTNICYSRAHVRYNLS